MPFQNRYPLRVNVGFLISQPVGSYRDIHFEVEDLALSEDLTIHQLKGIARYNRTPSGILVQGDFDASTTLECVRCLTEYSQSLKIHFDELYALRSRPISENGLVLPEDYNLDLAPLVREYFVLEEPISPICKPDCKGLCSVCGEDLNVRTCEHQLKKQG